jgi:hypothetical protein
MFGYGELQRLRDEFHQREEAAYERYLIAKRAERVGLVICGADPAPVPDNWENKGILQCIREAEGR